MYVILDFGQYDRTVFIPDSRVGDVKDLRDSFLDWMEDQPGCISIAGYAYGADDFLEYVNSVVLNGEEKAYFADGNISKNKKIKRIHF